MTTARRQHQSPDESAPLRAVAWLRVSTEEQAREGRAGLPRQRESALRVAKAKGYEVVDTLVVSDVSGSSTALAPEMQRLLRMAEAREIDVVIVSEMSRLVRPDDLTSLAILDNFKRSGVVLDVGGSIFDVGSPEGFLTSGLHALIAGQERMQLLRKMMQSKEERRKDGRCPGSAITLPTGISYDRKKDEWITTDKLWPIQEAFRLLHEGQATSITEAARAIGSNNRTLANQLRNPIYKGIRVIDTKRDLSVMRTKADGRQGDRPKIKRSPEEIISVRVFSEGKEPVSPERWDYVNKLLDEISMAYNLKVAKNSTWMNSRSGRVNSPRRGRGSGDWPMRSGGLRTILPRRRVWRRSNLSLRGRRRWTHRRPMQSARN